MLDFFKRSYVQTGNECQLQGYMLNGKFALVVCCAEVLLQPSFTCFVVLIHALPGELYHRADHGAYHGTEHCTD